MRIAFHDNSVSLRGTTVALFDYAYFNQEILGNESIIVYDNTHPANSDYVYRKFEKHFPIYSYNNFHNEYDDIITKEKCDASLFVKVGKWDGKISKESKNLINAIGMCNLSDVHGDVFAMGSNWLSKIVDNKIPAVPYMVNLPIVEGDLREELKIPKDAIVFGRNGGKETFDIDFVKQAIIDVVNKRSDVYFIFQFTDSFYNHKQIIHLGGNSDLDYKVKFMNTCDAMIHARIQGESFGLSCAEFSWCNKRIITYLNSIERSHIDILGDNALYYTDYNTVRSILESFEKKEGDFNFYKDYDPKIIMKKFKEIYLCS